MKRDYTKYVEAVLAGASIGSQAKLAYAHVNSIRQALLKHPGYEKAKAAGKLHSPGLHHEKSDRPVTQEAIDDVVSGTPIVEAARKHNVPYSSLRRSLHKVRPDIVKPKTLEGPPDSVEAKARALIRKAQKYLDEAQTLMRTLPGRENWVHPLAPVGVNYGKPKPKLREGRLTDDEIKDIVRDSLA